MGVGIQRSGLSRAEVFITTKVEEDEDAYQAARRNVEQMGLEYVDLVLIHRPPADGVGVDLWRGLIRARAIGGLIRVKR